MSKFSNYKNAATLFLDDSGNFFYKAFLTQPYTHAVNFSDHNIMSNTTKRMLSTKYLQNGGTQDQPNAINSDVVDIIVKTALWHNKLDNSYSCGTKVQEVQKIGANLYLMLKTVDDANKGSVFDCSIGKTMGGHDSMKATGIGKYISQLESLLYYVLSTNPVDMKSFIDSEVNAIVNALLTMSNGTIGTLKDISEQFITSLGIPVGSTQSNSLMDKLNNLLNHNLSNALENIITMGKNTYDESDKSRFVSMFVYRLNVQQLIQNAVAYAFKETFCILFKGVHTDLTDANAYAFYENVFKNWNKLDDPRVGLLYNSVVSLLYNDGTSENAINVVDVIGKDIPVSDRSKYRLNFNKLEPGSNQTIFGNNLPKIPDEFKGFYYTDANGKCKYEEFNNNEYKDFLNDLYVAIRETKISNGVKSKTINVYGMNLNLNTDLDNFKKCEFKLDVDKLVRDGLHDVGTPGIINIPIHNDIPYMDFPFQNIWQRAPNGDLVTFGASGKLDIKMQPIDDVKDDKCYTTGMNIKTECNTYVHECLLADDADGLNKCIKFLKDHKDTEDLYIKNEIENMHPLIALRTLQKFGFKGIKSYNKVLGREIISVQSVDNWIETFMKKKFTEEEVQRIFTGGNEHIVNYLQNVVSYVNKNPSILNKDVNTEVVQKYNTEYKTNSKPNRDEMIAALKQLKVHMRTNYSIIAPLVPPFIVGPFGLYDTMMNIPLVHSNMMMPTIGFSHPDVHFNPGMFTSVFKQRIDSGRRVGAALFRDLFEQVQRDLKDQGKKLVDSDTKNIIENIERMIATEKELEKVLMYLEEYNAYLDIFNGRVSSESVLNMKTLEQLLDRHKRDLEKYKKLEMTNMEVLNALASLYSDQNDGTYVQLENDLN